MNQIILKVLILGGTSFLGPHLVEELQDRGHHVTLFNRGTQSPPPNIESLKGNRDGYLAALQNRQWDAIIDTSGHLPRVVKDSSRLLANAAKHYTFISTVGVYDNFRSHHINEEYPLAKLEDAANEEINEKTYGALKAACEQVVQSYFPNRCLIIRPGLIIGPKDSTRRFSYWPLRVSEGGEILAPGNPNTLLQFIDVRDLAKWIVSMVEKQQTGVYNATGPDSSLSFEDFLRRCAASVCKDNALFTWVEEDFLIENGVQDWSEIPLWLSYKRQMPGFLNVNVQKAVRAGLAFRPLEETISAINAWEKDHKSDLPIGLDRKKEQELLKKWHQR